MSHLKNLAVVLILSALHVILLCDHVNSIPLVKQAMERNPIYGKYFEGDMRFPVDYDPIRNGIIGEKYRWPNKTVPYTISDKFSQKEIRIIMSAFAEISNKTCIRFVKRGEEENYVFIERGEPDSGCWSFVGLQGGKQILNLQPPPGPHCIWHGTVAHEMIHAIGFYHEQSRTDRDDYVTIIWNNIPQALQSNFGKYDSTIVDPQGVAYDYGSLMHYNAYAFAINSSLPTIVPKQNVTIGQNKGLSEGDALKIRKLYNCQ